MVGPPPEVDWSELGKGLFIFGMNGSKTLFQMHAPIHGLKSHAKRKNQWNFPSYVAVLPAHRWVQRLLSWHQFGTRRLGRPRHTWDFFPKKRPVCVKKIKTCWRWYSKSMCCNCVPAAVNMQPNLFWPTFRCKMVSFSPLSVARNGGGCASFVSTAVFSAFTESINCPNSWRERTKKKECHQRSVNQSNVGPHPSNRCQLVQRHASIFAWQLPKQQQITVDWERSLVAHRLWSGIGHFDRSHRQFHHVVCSTPVVKPESNFEELLAQTRPSTKYSLIKSALQGVVLHGNHVVLQVALHQVHPPIFQRGGMEMFYYNKCAFTIRLKSEVCFVLTFSVTWNRWFPCVKTHHCTIIVMHPKFHGEHALTVPQSTQPRPPLYHFSISQLP